MGKIATLCEAFARMSVMDAFHGSFGRMSIGASFHGSFDMHEHGCFYVWIVVCR